jgi:hypothetical protein
MAAERISVRCCIAGGGPAGMMLGYLPHLLTIKALPWRLDLSRLV